MFNLSGGRYNIVNCLSFCQKITDILSVFNGRLKRCLDMLLLLELEFLFVGKAFRVVGKAYDLFVGKAYFVGKALLLLFLCF